MEIRKGIEECPQRRDAFDPGQGRTEADMHAGGESQVFTGIFATDVKPGWVDEDSWVAIGAAEKEPDHLAGRDVLSVDLDVDGRCPGGHLYRAVDPKYLFDGSGP